MSETVGLTSGALDRAAALVGAARSDLQGLGGRLTARLAGSQAGWRGSGARSFAEFQAIWSERHRAIVAALDGFEGALRASEALTQRTDAEQASTYDSASAGLR
jgi:WXG100 family type VII secretion target